MGLLVTGGFVLGPGPNDGPGVGGLFVLGPGPGVGLGVGGTSPGHEGFSQH